MYDRYHSGSRSLSEIVSEAINELANGKHHKGSRTWPDNSPCDSPIEDIFYWEYQKRMRNNTSIQRQVKVVAGGANYRLDFLIEMESYRLAIE